MTTSQRPLALAAVAGLPPTGVRSQSEAVIRRRTKRIFASDRKRTVEIALRVHSQPQTALDELRMAPRDAAGINCSRLAIQSRHVDRISALRLHAPKVVSR